MLLYSSNSLWWLALSEQAFSCQPPLATSSIACGAASSHTKASSTRENHPPCAVFKQTVNCWVFGLLHVAVSCLRLIAKHNTLYCITQKRQLFWYAHSNSQIFYLCQNLMPLTHLNIDESSDSWGSGTLRFCHEVTADLSPEWEEWMVIAASGCCRVGTNRTSL